MKPIIREYQNDDYQACEDLVERTWRFSEYFRPSGFCGVAKHMYTFGSVASSNFKRVIESDGRVVGFLFGRNEKKPLDFGILRQLGLSLAFLGRLLRVKQMSFGEKRAFLGVLNQHAVNRREVEKHNASEVCLFALDEAAQRQGFGRELLLQFLEDCKLSGVERVIVEVNVSQASGFYEKCGFIKIGDFVSPLHEIAAGKGSTAAMYEHDLVLSPADSSPRLAS